jgi:hypothetical protein
MQKWLLVALFFLYLPGSYAQSGLYYWQKQYDDDPFDELTYFYAGANYQTNNVYMGRKDSIALPYISPYIGYQFYFGLYAKASVSYAPGNKNGHFDLYTFELGYDRTFGKHILTGVSYESLHYYKNSPSTKASTKSITSLYCLYKNEKLEPQLTISQNQNNSSDLIINLSLDHNFRFKDNTFNVFPTISFFYGSMNFYNDYFLAKLHKQDNTITDGNFVKNAGQNQPLAVEFSVKAMYRAKSWLFTLTPTYIAPLSAATIILPNGVLTEKLTSSFLVTLDACHRHERK